MIRVCPSILNVERASLSETIASIESSADLLHLDVMDNVFVPNQTFTFAQSEKIIKETSLSVDAHLMISDPDDQAVKYAQAGAASVTFHLEASANPLKTIEAIKEHGARVGIALKPDTGFEKLAPLLEFIDMALIMTVEPGFGGQSFMHTMMGKVEEARKEIDALDFKEIWLQVDGGISLETILIARAAGADTFVAGNAVFKADNPIAAIDLLRRTAATY